jgi:hypothetical protein
MKKTVIMVLFLLLCPVWAVLGQQSQGEWEPFKDVKDQKRQELAGQQAGQALTNESIIGLVKVGFSDETIISMIQHEPGNYSLRVDDVIALKKAGVSEGVIAAMSSKMAIGPTPAPKVAAPVAAGPPELVLKDGTALHLRLVDEGLSSATATVGQIVEFAIVEEIAIDNQVVIPYGSPAFGTVVEAQPKRRLGRGGKLNVSLTKMRLADGEWVYLAAVKNARGGGHTGPMIAGMAATAIIWPVAPVWLLIEGKDITIPKGTRITAYTQGDMHLDASKFQKPAQINAAPL